MDDHHEQAEVLRRQAANHLALQKASQVDPVWCDVLRAADAVGLEDKTLLHAGPPFKNSRSPSAPILSSAVIACLYEGWAEDERGAERLIKLGLVKLKPSQNYGVVTPLAAVISPSTSLVEVVDRHTNLKAWSLLSSGAGPQIRFGYRDLELLERMTYRDQILAPLLKKQLKKQAVPLVPLAIVGMVGGDDLHYQTSVATLALERFFVDRGADSEIVVMLNSAPLFYLTLWMASCRLILNAMCQGESARNSSLVVSLAANGESIGVCLSRSPQKWSCVPALVPNGPAIVDHAGDEKTLMVSGAIGDSGVIDVAGFGAQLWHDLPSISTVMKDWYEPGLGRLDHVMTGVLGSVTSKRVYSGLDVSHIQSKQDCPGLAIAMLDKRGRKGLIGKGIVNLPLALFQQANAA